MAGKTTTDNDIAVPSDHVNLERRRSSRSIGKSEKKPSVIQKMLRFLYDPRKKTVLGRDALNWAKLATFYTIFYFFLGCFFLILLNIFASILDRTEPRYYNAESTMAVRSTAAVVGMGFRPQPLIDDSLIRVSDDPTEQIRIASSLRLFRDVFLIQNSDSKIENCTEVDPASDLPAGTACAFNWFHVVNSNDHPCSDNNLYGFKQEKPCVLVKLNKVYGWKPSTGVLPVNIQKLRGIHSNRSTQNPDVYVTCEGTNVADNDALKPMTYYSVAYPSGSDKLGVIPNYYFPYRNAKDHVQPFVLVQFHDLPLNRLIGVTCRAWAPGIEHNVRGVRGMVNFQLYRTKVGTHYWSAVVQFQCSSTTMPRTPRLESSFYEHFQYRTMKTCRNESKQIFLTIAILSSYERLLIYLPSILNTWALLATNEVEIIIFIEEKFSIPEESIEKLFLRITPSMQSCLFTVKLKHVENAYPPQKKSFYAMKFMHIFYAQRTSWILRLDDNAYVNIEDLVRWLKSLDHTRILYIGQGGTGRRNGPPIHLLPGEYFCMGGSGIILSQQILVQLAPWLDHCYNREILTTHEDVELGRCILNHLHISCTNAYDAKDFFYHHHGPRYSFASDLTPTILSRALIIHPIKDQQTFYQIFAFYLRKKRDQQVRLHKKLPIEPRDYVTFTTTMEFDLVRDVHYQLMDVKWRSYIQKIVKSYVETVRLVWYQRSYNWSIVSSQFLFGYHRVIPSYCLEATIEILLNIRLNLPSFVRNLLIRKRFHLRHAFVSKHNLDYREISIEENDENAHLLNLIVVSSNKDPILFRFLEHFKHEVLDHPIRCNQFTLSILYFASQNQFVPEHIRQLSSRYSSIVRISLVDRNQTSYNRGLGRQLALKLFTDNQILFFLDVDLVFTGQALDNIRRLMLHQLSISPCFVYFPIIFSLFSNKFTANNRSSSELVSETGSFSIYGYGNVAVRKQDLDRIGGWQTNNQEWGYEDVDLFQRFSRASTSCTIFRAVEPGLKHYYHPKMCHEIIDKTRRKMCFDANHVLLGSQAQMVDYLVKSDKKVF
ncbi:unnamed protein product [Adineta ricciae]|uniref:Hexosyltransferase n=1 Tax=Adineta ricciae TaxID=249248 RepID=A0A813S614_ADIRI|nr:unnamed protein product [Adineta ricciae]